MLVTKEAYTFGRTEYKKKKKKKNTPYPTRKYGTVKINNINKINPSVYLIAI